MPANKGPIETGGRIVEEECDSDALWLRYGCWQILTARTQHTRFLSEEVSRNQASERRRFTLPRSSTHRTSSSTHVAPGQPDARPRSARPDGPWAPVDVEGQRAVAPQHDGAGELQVHPGHHSPHCDGRRVYERQSGGVAGHVEAVRVVPGGGAAAAENERGGRGRKGRSGQEARRCGPTTRRGGCQLEARQARWREGGGVRHLALAERLARSGWPGGRCLRGWAHCFLGASDWNHVVPVVCRLMMCCRAPWQC